MGNLREEIKTFAQEAQNFAEAKIETIRLDAIEKSVTFAGVLMSWLVITVIALMVFITVSAAVGILLSSAMDSYAAGFGIIAGFYILLLIILIVFRRQLLGNLIEEKMYGVFLQAEIEKQKETGNEQ